MNPIADLLLFKYQRDFAYAPQQSMSRVANRVSQQTIDGENQFEDIVPQVDGLDYNPNQADLKFRGLPMLEFNTEKVGFQRWAHTWNYAIATEDLSRIKPEFRMQIPRLTRESWERFKDRVIAGNADGNRVTQGDANYSAPTKSVLGKDYRYAVKASKAATSLSKLNLSALLDLQKSMYASEVYDPMTGKQETPILVAAHEQISGLLEEDKIVNRDYNSVLALTRGDVNSFMGFEFVRTAAVGKLLTSQNIRVSNVDNTVEISANALTNHFTPTGGDKILVCQPKAAFAMGIYPQAGYMHVWQNPNRAGAWEYYFKNVISWKRCQDKFVRVAYAASDADPARQDIRVTPTKGAAYHDNADGGTTWDYAATV